MDRLKDWIPFFSQLVWPSFLIGFLVLFRDQVSAILARIEQAIAEGRSVQVFNLLKIGERTSIAELSSTKEFDVGEGIDLSLESVQGYKDFVEKSSELVLTQLRERLRQTPTQRIDVLLVSAGREYSTKLLSRYISTLGIRFVVFQDNNRFQGWIDAGLFNSQMPTRDEVNWPYARLWSELIGIRQDSVSPKDSAIDVLAAMETANTENMAVVDMGKFRFMVNRESILSKLLTAAVLKKRRS